MSNRALKRTGLALIGTGLSFALSVGPAFAQDTDQTFDGEWRYNVSCGSCHGMDGEGISAFGPPVRGNNFVINSPPVAIVRVIQEGRFNRDKAFPDYAGMPAFPKIRAAEARALIEYMKTALQE